MKQALISPGEDFRICQVSDAKHPIAQPLFWVECDDAVTTEWTYLNGVFVAPPPLEE